jgi:hypothetical protein
MDPLTLGAISSGIGMIAGYAQYRKGQKEAKKLDELGLESMAEATLPEYRDVEAKYRQISETGLGAAEINEFMKRAQTSMYAQQMGAQTMAGGSLARYTLAMNNANYLNQMGILAGQQFQRRMQGLTGYERQLGMRQARTDADIQLENQRRLAAGQAAANLSAQGLQNIIGGVSSLGTVAAYSAMGSGGKTYGGTVDTGTSAETGASPSAKQFSRLNSGYKIPVKSMGYGYPEDWYGGAGE